MSGKQRDYTSEWSEWQWSEELQCKYATRYGPTGNIEYDYLNTPRYEGNWPSENATDPAIPSSPEQQTAYTTSPSTSNKVKTSNINLPPGYNQPSSAGPSTSTREINDVTSRIQNMALPTLPENGPSITIQGPDGQQAMAKQILTSVNTKMLDDRYIEIDERKNKKFWKLGRVFMMLWTEPARSQPSSRGVNNATNGSHYGTVWLGSQVYSEIRRFVVVGSGYGNVICSPIHTYQGQATLKANLPDPQQHAIIYTSSSPPEELSVLDEEGNIVRESLSKDPIRVVSELKGPDGDLGLLSRINYAKLYTVEKYVRILNIGKVHDDSMESLLASCFFARPPDQPPQGPRKSKSSRGGNRDEPSDNRDSQAQSSRSGRHHRRP